MLRPSRSPVHHVVVCRGPAPVPDALRGAVVAIGNFDGVHLGHRRLVEQATRSAASSGRPGAVLTFDPHPRAFFAPDAPHFRLTSEPMKLRLLAALGIDAVFIRSFDAAMAAMTAREFVFGLVRDDLAASALVIGGDFHFGRAREGSPDTLRGLAAEAGIDVTVADTVEVDGAPVSSSRIRERLAAGDIVGANGLLGYRWFVDGAVIHGEKRGRTLGFPTANLRLEPGCGLAHGIYAVRVATDDGGIHDGVASFGRRPTFDDGAPLLETHLFDFAGDLYGRTIDVEFVGWIRGEARFASADELVVAMNADARGARALLRDAEASSSPRSLIALPRPPYTE